jgi:hypothetical protein
MRMSIGPLRGVAIGGVLLALFQFQTAPAVAACGALVEKATGNSIASAAARAKTKAMSKVAKTAGAAALAKTTFSEPACVYLDDGSNRVRCEVTASFCVDPPPPGGNSSGKKTPILPGLPQFPGTGKVKSCTSLKANATGNGLSQATSLVRSTLDSAIRQQTGKTLNSPGVSYTEPACYHLDNGTDHVRCEMNATACP